MLIKLNQLASLDLSISKLLTGPIPNWLMNHCQQTIFILTFQSTIWPELPSRPVLFFIIIFCLFHFLFYVIFFVFLFLFSFSLHFPFFFFLVCLFSWLDVVYTPLLRFFRCRRWCCFSFFIRIMSVFVLGWYVHIGVIEGIE